MGGTELMNIDVRVVAATNRNLEHLVEQGLFRQDLYYRLNLFTINNIPLRERKEDIPVLVQYFVEKCSRKIGKSIQSIPKKALEELMQYEFPGNVRELKSLVERAVLLSESNKLHLETQFFTALSFANTSFKGLEDMQRDYILEALRRANGQVTGAAKLLKMNDKTLYSKIQKLKINRQKDI